ncbi:conserved hypothetical protein [Arthrobacter sp. 9V]|nr:conserved hypothetical protein [Arthrobacter sp. 9V]
MVSKSVADGLGEIIVGRKDFQDLVTKIERIVTDGYLGVKRQDRLSSEELGNLLRYADVLSHSSISEHRSFAYGVISFLNDYGDMAALSSEEIERVRGVAEAVLIQLGNFPGLRTLHKVGESKYALPVSKGAVRVAKEIAHSNSRNDAVLTDAQFRIVSKMRATDFFSFSGPTSLGKSFIIKDSLYDIVRNDDLNQRSVVVLVPTKALVGQTAEDLRNLFKEVPEVHVATYPSLPRVIRDRYSRTVFVFTPERLVRYLSNPVREIDYLIVDEAQKIVAENDARSSLYYHAIVEVTRLFAAKLIFSSPSISNPEIFLELFGKSTNGALAVKERTVTQQRYLIDFIGQKQYHYSAYKGSPREVAGPPDTDDSLRFIIKRSGLRKAIIYVNGSQKAASVARDLAALLSPVSDVRTQGLIRYVQEFVHAKYFLADTLRNGVAYHHGKMPQEIREKIESIYADPHSPVQYIVCTSTLLEGVNLPAKNIFIMSDKHGFRKFSPIDFENLVGRAGRLTYDFSGNVVCIRDDEKRWDSDARDLIPSLKSISVSSFLVDPPSNRKKDYTDIEHVLRNRRVPGNPSADKLQSIRQYASILTLHAKGAQPSPLLLNFLSKVPGGSDLLKSVVNSVDYPEELIRSSPDILPKYQSALWRELKSASAQPLIPEDADLGETETFHDALRLLSRIYAWQDTESTGRSSLVSANSKPKALDRRLKYWALLMKSWVRGDQLNRLIRNSINFHIREVEFSYEEFVGGRKIVKEPFDPTSAKHINIVIENLLLDIEGGLRFRVISYLQNYYESSIHAMGIDRAGVNVARLVEYGTTDPRAVELQEVGFGRSVALKLVEDHAEVLTFSDSGELIGIEVEALLSIEQLDDDIRMEVESLLVKSEADLVGNPGVAFDQALEMDL